MQALLELGSTEIGKEMLSRIPIRLIGITSVGDYESIGTWGLEPSYEKHWFVIANPEDLQGMQKCLPCP